jgi:hypothetical protein
MVTNIVVPTLTRMATTLLVTLGFVLLGPIGASGGLDSEGVVSSVGVGGGLIAAGEIARLLVGQKVT